ncbi:MAG: hypothetical protein ACO3FK_01365 [Vulcanococcus sp.]
MKEVLMASLRLHAMLPLALGGLVMVAPVAGLPMGELQALNRELGRLCSDPPREALAVCRIHARLVRAL